MKKIKLTQDKYALVDNDDFEFLNQWKWYATKQGNTFYAHRDSRNRKRNKGNIVSMHREIMNNPNNKLVDHIDGNGLNNQRKNLRFCTKSENGMNQKIHKNSTSKLKGVTFDKSRQKYLAQINVNKRKIFIGRFINKEDAYKAYCEACKKYHREFANIG